MAPVFTVGAIVTNNSIRSKATKLVGVHLRLQQAAPKNSGAGTQAPRLVPGSTIEAV